MHERETRLSRCRTYQSVVFHSFIPVSLFSIRPLCVQYVQAHFLDFFQCKQKHTHRPTRVKSPKARERWILVDNNVLSPHSPSCMSTSAWMNGWSSMHARRYRRRKQASYSTACLQCNGCQLVLLLGWIVSLKRLGHHRSLRPPPASTLSESDNCLTTASSS